MRFPRELDPRLIREFAERVDAGGVDELWVIEDCFYTAGISLAATALARTERLVVGLGILPAVARTAAVTAMELATLGQLAPGRIIGGIGHGIQEWMGQMGVRPARPVATLEATIGGRASPARRRGASPSTTAGVVSWTASASIGRPDAPTAGAGRRARPALAGRRRTLRRRRWCWPR